MSSLEETLLSISVKLDNFDDYLEVINTAKCVKLKE